MTETAIGQIINNLNNIIKIRMETIFVKRLFCIWYNWSAKEWLLWSFMSSVLFVNVCVYDSGWIEEYTLTRDLMTYFLLCIDKSGLYNKKHIRNKNSVSTQEFGFFIFERFRLNCNQAAWELVFFLDLRQQFEQFPLLFF